MGFLWFSLFQVDRLMGFLWFSLFQVDRLMGVLWYSLFQVDRLMGFLFQVITFHASAFFHPKCSVVLGTHK